MTSSAAISPAAATAPMPVSQRLRIWRCLTAAPPAGGGTVPWLACAGARYYPPPDVSSSALSACVATVGIHGRQAVEPVYPDPEAWPGLARGTPRNPA